MNIRVLTLLCYYFSWCLDAFASASTDQRSALGHQVSPNNIMMDVPSIAAKQVAATQGAIAQGAVTQAAVAQVSATQSTVSRVKKKTKRPVPQHFTFSRFDIDESYRKRQNQLVEKMRWPRDYWPIRRPLGVQTPSVFPRLIIYMPICDEVKLPPAQSLNIGPAGGFSREYQTDLRMDIGSPVMLPHGRQGTPQQNQWLLSKNEVW